MNGSGCENCPVNPCETMNYRGSTCAAQREKFGLGDPQTKADRIRAMSDEELADFITDKEKGWCTDIGREMYYQYNLEWLKQPVEVSGNA